MKVTKKEVEKAVEALYGDSYGYNAHIGVEPDGDMIVVAEVEMVAFAPEFAQAFSMAVMSLAKKHGETYTPYIMGKTMFERYVAYNGFVEGPESSILDEEWEIDEQVGDALPIIDTSGNRVASIWDHKFAIPMTALPDALRVLNAINEAPALNTVGDGDRLELSGELWSQLVQVLKKAGI